MKDWVGLGVIGDNLINIGRLLSFAQDIASPSPSSVVKIIAHPFTW